MRVMTKLAYLTSSVMVAGVLLMATLFTLLTLAPPTLAQNAITITKQLNRTSNVVQVGEVLSFTIAVTNNSVFSLTSVTLVDTYDQSVMAFARAIPPPNSLNTVTGVITWDNVVAPSLPLGQGITVTVIFTVEHPKPATVNFVRGQDIISGGTSLSQTAENSKTNEAIGGAAPVLKVMYPQTATPQIGLPITFAHIITNDGLAIMTVLPLTDVYNATYLDFNYAIPTPTVISPPGTLVWTDLTTYFGDLAPFQSVVVTTVFTATTQVISTVNSAGTGGARDIFNNDLTAGLAQVPIIIIAAPITDTNDSDDSDDSDNSNGSDDDDDDDDGEVAPALPTATATTIVAAGAATATVTLIDNQTVITDENIPRYLPETGYQATGGYQGLVVMLLLLLLVGYLFRSRVRLIPFK